MLQSVGLILLSLAFIISVKKLKARIKTVEKQLIIALNTSAWVINSAENRKQLIGMLGQYVLTTQTGIEDPEFRKSLLEATPDMSWEKSVENAEVAACVLDRFSDDENPLTNGGYFYRYHKDANQSE